MCKTPATRPNTYMRKRNLSHPVTPNSESVQAVRQGGKGKNCAVRRASRSDAIGQGFSPVSISPAGQSLIVCPSGHLKHGESRMNSSLLYPILFLYYLKDEPKLNLILL